MYKPFLRMSVVLVLAVVTTAGCDRSAERSAIATSASQPAIDAKAPVKKRSAVAGMANGLIVGDARLVLPAVPGRPAAAYFTIRNPGSTPRKLMNVVIAGASESQMHETSGGTMRALGSVEVPANGAVQFTAGGRHVMVFGLPSTLRTGGVQATLTFDRGDRVTTALAIQPPGGADPMAGMKMN